MTQTDIFNPEEINRLKLKIGCAELVMTETDSNELTVTIDGKDEDSAYEVKQLGNLLQIIHEPGNHVVITKGHMDTCITLAVPQGLALQSMELELGAGTASMLNGTTTYGMVNMEIGAGKLEAEQLKVSDSLDISVGAGSANLNHVNLKCLDIECGVGKLCMNGAVSQDINVDCGVGKVELNLENSESSYNFQVSSALGKVSVNGSSFQRFASSSSIQHQGATGTMNLNCGIGKISIQTA